jgi:hypothetical protein
VNVSWLHHSNRGELRHGDTACRVAAQRKAQENPRFLLVVKTVTDRPPKPADHSRSSQQQPSPQAPASPAPDTANKPASATQPTASTSPPKSQAASAQQSSTAPPNPPPKTPEHPAAAPAPSTAKGGPPAKRPGLLSRSSSDKGQHAQGAGADPKSGRRNSFFSNLSTKFSSQPRAGPDSPAGGNGLNSGPPTPPSGNTGGQSSPAPVGSFMSSMFEFG